jgi:DsbC/DsbD-like thiol-disulfide interchange protein
MRIRYAVLLAVTAATPATAAQTGWRDVAPDVRVRLISDDTLSLQGTTQVGIEIDMPQSYKTYWEVPGEAGIPTQVDWAGSTGIADPVIAWPFPSREETSGLTDYVYHGPTVLPVTLKVDGDQPKLKASIVMGVCSDICVPVMTDFELDLSFAKPDAGQALRLSQARAETPIDWDKPGPAFDSVTYDPAKGGILAKLADSAIDPASIIVSTPDPSQIFGAPQKSQEPGLVFVPLLGNDTQKRFDRGSVQLTFMTDAGPYMVVPEVGLAGATSTGQ